MSACATSDDREAILATTPTPNGGPTWLELAERAAAAHGVPLGELLALRRHATAVRARAQVWGELLDLGYSYPEIAANWCVDHTSVLHVIRVYCPDVAARRTAQVERQRRARLARGPGVVAGVGESPASAGPVVVGEQAAA